MYSIPFTGRIDEIRNSRPDFRLLTDKEIHDSLNLLRQITLEFFDKPVFTFIQDLALPEPEHGLLIDLVLDDITALFNKFTLSNHGTKTYFESFVDLGMKLRKEVKCEAAHYYTLIIIRNNLNLNSKILKGIRVIKTEFAASSDEDVTKSILKFLNNYIKTIEELSAYVKEYRFDTEIEKKFISQINRSINFIALKFFIYPSFDIHEKIKEFIENFIKKVQIKFFAIFSEEVKKNNSNLLLPTINDALYELKREVFLKNVKGEAPCQFTLDKLKFISDIINYLKNKNVANLKISPLNFKKPSNTNITFKNKEFKNLEPSYLLPLITLQKIHSVFNNDLWESIPLYDFYMLFDVNNSHKIEYKILKVMDFIALLKLMHNVSENTYTLDDFIKPLIKRGGASPRNIDNIMVTRINSDKPKHIELRKKIENLLK